jgi:hypothetical protein
MKDDPTSDSGDQPLPGISQERFDHLTFDLDLDENGRSRRYPFVPPEVFETPMTDDEFKRFIAGLEEAKSQIEAQKATK